MTDTLLQLAARCEAATGPDREKPKGEPDTDFNAGVGLGEVPAHWEYGRSFATPALALCAASLKARAAQGGEQ